MARRQIALVAVAALIVCAALSACSTSGESNDVNATSTTAKPGQFPWMASTQLAGGNPCGGALIKSTWVLTGKHCHDSVIADNPDRWQVRVNSIDRTTGGELIAAKRFVDYPDENVDLSLIELVSPASVTPLALVDEGNTRPYEVGAKAISLGWGTDGISKKSTKILDWTAQITAPNDTCGGGANGVFCAGRPDNQGSGMCTFDSGAPLVWAADGFAADGTPASKPYVVATLRGLFNETCGVPGKNDDWQSAGAAYGQWIRTQIQ